MTQIKARNIADGFMADIDPALVQQIFDISKRERKSDVQNHRKADDLRASFEVL